jgi:hypothetical protein
MSAEFLRMQEMKVLRRAVKDGASLERVPRINRARKATQTGAFGAVFSVVPTTRSGRLSRRS